MAQDLQSIEDLILASRGAAVKDDGSAQSKFAAKQKEIKIKEMERQAQITARSLGLRYINLFGFPISPEAIALIPEERAKLLGMVCFHYDGLIIRVAVLDPNMPEVKAILQSLMEKLHVSAELYYVSRHSMVYVLDLYRAVPKVVKTSVTIEVKEADLDRFSDQFQSFRDLQKAVDAAAVSDIVTMIMAAAIKTNSSDIHIEAEENGIGIRFRVDGVLHDAAMIDKDLWKKIISRLKVLAKVKINVTDKPQDGRMSIQAKDERIDIRVSFLPTNYGESVVMRILRSSAVGLDFDSLGIRGRAFEQLKREIGRPNGMIITTGPTGSGKTTTLYAILKKLNDPETKIITIEDPIEYQLEGINQSQASEKYTFAHGLKSIVRQDPDVIMVGEIRDLETAEIAIQAALTGHLVLSTIHTNDAAGTIPRFLSMGAKPFLLAPAMNAMIGQRLVRRLCTECKEETALTTEEKERVKRIIEAMPYEERPKEAPETLKFYRGKGCEKCQGLGYKGRIGIYEIMAMNQEVEKIILSAKVSEYDMRDAGSKMGMLTMEQDGLLKALEGTTSADEVFRVTKEI
jgi:type IV pilus assembly protein PilB